ncbi:MAG TPA: CHAT domain-containing protein [Streptosporangiaceae bacterium]
MAGGAYPIAPDSRDVDDLLPLALSRPKEALARARTVLAGRPDVYESSIAHQAAGIVMREFGDVEAGVREVRTALRLARRAGLAEREADVLATLGVALVYAGRTTAGLAALDGAVRRSRGVLGARVLVRRGMMLWTLGYNAAALSDFRPAVTVLRRAGDLLWTARAINARTLVYLALGLTARADADFASAGRLFNETGQELEAIYTVHNRGLAAFFSGDLPAALSHLDTAANGYRRLSVPVPTLSIDRCAVLLAAGLAVDALAEAHAAVRDMERVRGQSTKKAELLLTAAECALAAAHPQNAQEWAQAAYRLFRSQHSDWWQAQAARVLVQARYAAGPVSPGLLREANRAAIRLDALGAGDATQAHLLAGRVALDLGHNDQAERHLLAAARSRRRGTPMSRATGWLSEALRAQTAGNPRRLLSACRHGLAVLDEHRLSFGASELRAQATAHGAELAALAQRYAVRAHNPRLLLSWSERWRATAQAIPAVRPVADAELHTALAALRDVTRRLEGARSEGTPTAGLQREQRRLENTVRASALRSPGSTQSAWASGVAGGAFAPAELLDELGAARLIEIIEVDGDLHVLACGGGKVRQFAAGRAADAIRAADFARFALRRIARSRPAKDLDSALSILAATGPRLEQALLGPAVRHLGDGPVVIVPPGRLHAIPWGILPALRDRVVSVAPSAAAWMRAHIAPEPQRRNVTLARGPGLASGGAEVPAVAGLYDDVTVLADAEATAEKVLYALDGAWLAHVAAHGVFRADSPLFSSLHMHDGPLTVYDFEQLRQAPYRLILSSCDSGVLAPTGADELLGLVSTLLPLGTAGIIAATLPLNDHAAVPVMVGLHRHLRAGRTLAESLCDVRRELTDDVQQATAASLIALGAA